MCQRLPPRERDNTNLDYYTKGEFSAAYRPSRFASHSAEASVAAPLCQRSPPKTQDIEIKPVAPFIRSGGYRRGLFSNQGENSVAHEHPASLTAVKILQSKEYTNLSKLPCHLASRTLPFKEYSEKNYSFSSTEPLSLPSAYFYPSKAQKRTPPKDIQSPSMDSPEWFQIRQQNNVASSDITKSPNFDGTITVLSKISGWATVTPIHKSRNNRLGKQGPFKIQDKKPVTHVSDMAPAWMHTHHKKNQSNLQFYKNVGHPCIRENIKRTYIVDSEQPQRSVFSIGDFRHNVNTEIEARENAVGLLQVTKNMFEWKEDVSKQKYDKPVTAKVGC